MKTSLFWATSIAVASRRSCAGAGRRKSATTVSFVSLFYSHFLFPFFIPSLAAVIDKWMELAESACEHTRISVGHLPFEAQCAHCERESINVSLANLLTCALLSSAAGLVYLATDACSVPGVPVQSPG